VFERVKEILRHTESEPNKLFEEVLVLTLARASHADSNVSGIEVKKVRSIIARETGSDVSEADIRVAAGSELFESAPLSAYLRAATRSLKSSQRAKVLQGLLEAIGVDDHVTPGEVDFFNMVADSLRASPAEIAGLASD